MYRNGREIELKHRGVYKGEYGLYKGKEGKRLALYRTVAVSVRCE